MDDGLESGNVSSIWTKILVGPHKVLVTFTGKGSLPVSKGGEIIGFS